MNINPKDLMFGQPILKIREVIRNSMCGKSFGDSKTEIIKKVAIILNISNTATKKVIEQLIAEEYLVLNKKKWRNEYYYVLDETLKGRRFGISKAIPAISRQKATQLLNDLIKRAEDINSNKELAYFVEQIKVFGSYLTDKEKLGDLDVGVKISGRKCDDVMALRQKRVSLAIANGKYFDSYMDQVYYPLLEVELMLKNKQRSLSLHDLLLDQVFNDTETRLVYQYEENISE
jgi:predicted transcriptional regulator